MFIVDHRHEHGVVGGVAAAVIDRVVEEEVAALQIGVIALHHFRHHVRARQDVDRQRVVRRQQLAIARQDAAREIAGDVEHA